MIKKLSIVAMAGLFSVSAAGLGFADEKVIPVPVTPAMPDVRGEVKKEIKDVKSKAKQMKEEAVKAVTPPIMAPVPATSGEKK